MSKEKELIRSLKRQHEFVQPIATEMILPNKSGHAGGQNFCFADGSATLPSVHFCSDPTTGFYRPEADRIAFTMKGAYGGILYEHGFLMKDGTSATPSLGFENSSSTGFYRQAANTIGFTSNNTLRMTMDGSDLELLDGQDLKMTGSTSGTITHSVPATVTSHTLTWPSAQGAANTYLKNNGSGTLSWSAASSEAFPIGSVFIAVVSTNPGTLLGYGTWVAFATGQVLVGIDGADEDFDTVEETGGAKTKAHVHSIDSSGNATISNNHTYQAVNAEIVAAGATGSYRAHALGGTTETTAATTIQPYIVVYMWKRTA